MKAVIFDVDGVLSDSLGTHIRFCQEMNKRYGLGLKLPDAKNGRSVAGTPMDNFFRKAGFPERLIPELVAAYTKEFGAYSVPQFKGARELLLALKKEGCILGIATSNYSKNVARALGQNAKLFDAIYAKDNSENKAEAIKKFAQRFGLGPRNIIFVGDTLSDKKSAETAGVRFVGMTHGWEITKDHAEETASSLRELRLLLVRAARERKAQIIRKNRPFARKIAGKAVRRV